MLNIKKLLTKILEMFIGSTTTYTTTSLQHLASASATLYRVGKVGILHIYAKNTSSSLTVGSSATFTISGLPTLAIDSKGCGYSGNTVMIGGVDTNGSVVLRATASDWLGGYDTIVTIPVLFT